MAERSRRPDKPRIPPLAADEHSEDQRQLVGGVAANVPASNIFATLVRHPGLFRHWLPFGGKLLAGKLPGRERELVEVPMLVGHYHMVAYSLNSLGVQREEGIVGLPERAS